MRVVYGFGKVNFKKASCVTIGVFDGVHRGHQRIIAHTVAYARARHLRSIVITFHPHPDSLLKKNKKTLLLISLAHRLHLLRQLGVEVCIIVHFTDAFRMVSPEHFVELLVKRCGMRHFFLSRRFVFGKNREGTISLVKSLAKKYHFSLHIEKIEKYEGLAISSTLIRALIQKGDLRKAEELLDRKVEVHGSIIGGDRLGRRLGIPTANIDPHHEVVPPRGVYLIEAWLGKRKFPGVANIGFRPTISKEKKEIIEVHLINFNTRIYGRDIRIMFLKKIRDEQTFSTLSELTQQIHRDIYSARKYFHL